MRSWAARQYGPRRRGRRDRRRAGQASIDYVLILGVILPLVAFMVIKGREIMSLVYEFTCVLVSWPFM
jgi:hypothetical protein